MGGVEMAMSNTRYVSARGANEVIDGTSFLLAHFYLQSLFFSCGHATL